jgi:hypothetical protein
VGREILCFLPELPLDLGSAITLLFGNLDVDTLLENHFAGFVRNWVKPDGEFERVMPGDDAEGIRRSWGLNALDDGAPRRGAMDLSKLICTNERMALIGVVVKNNIYWCCGFPKPTRDFLLVPDQSYASKGVESTYHLL